MHENRRPLLFAAILVAALCVAYLVSTTWQGSDVLEPTENQNSTSRTKTADLEDSQADDEGRQQVVDIITTDLSANESAKTFTLRGRCLLADDKTPLANCTAQTRRELTATESLDPWPAGVPSAEVITEADGIFELQVPIDPSRENSALCLSAEGFVSRVARWKRPATGSIIDVGDIEMDRAIRVTGMVSHPNGEPVGDVAILFANIAMTGQTLVEPERMLRTRTDSSGRFSLDHPAFYGEWYPRVEGSGALIEPQMVVLGKSSYPTYDIQLSVEKPDPKFSITGICKDEAGQALDDVHVTGSGDGFRGQGWSHSDGSVTIPRGGPSMSRGLASLWAYDTAGLYEQILPAPETKFKWGDRDVQFVLRRLAEHSVQVVDARGKAVTKFSIFTFRANPNYLSLYPRLSLHGKHTGGTVKLKGLRNGENSVLVVPKSEGLGTSQLIPFVADSTAAPGVLTVTAMDLATLEIEVRDPSGAPIAGSRIELVQSLKSGQPLPSSKVTDVADCDRERTAPQFLRITEAKTDADGRARLQASPASWYLRITGKSHTPIVQAVQISNAGNSLQVTAQPGCTLSGTVSPKPALDLLRQLSAGKEHPVTVELRTSAVRAPVLAEVEADGSYSKSGLAPGKYSVSLRYWTRSSNVTEGWIKVPIADIEFPPSHHERLEIDAESCIPCQLSGRISVDGAPLKGKHCFAKRSDPSPQLMLRFSTGENGQFEVSVPPGTYTYSITLEAQPGPGWVMMTVPETFTLQAGDKRESAIDIAVRKLRVQVLDKTDKPLPNQLVKISAKGFHRPGTIRTDADGWAMIDPAPLTEFHLSMNIGGIKQKLGPIDLPSGQTRGDVKVRQKDGE